MPSLKKYIGECINVDQISLNEIIEAENINISLDNKFTDTINHAHEFLMQQIKTKPIYGITTGYGSSGKNYVSYDDAQRLQKNLFRFLKNNLILPEIDSLITPVLCFSH